MSDFFQSGRIATLHRLGSVGTERLDSELVTLAKQRPMALVLPSLFSEFSTDAMKLILEELARVRYIDEVVLTLGPANEDEFKEACRRLAPLPMKKTVLWNSGPRLTGILDTLEEAELSIGLPGKGRSAWMAYGYVLSLGRHHGIALHDCDIKTYSRELLARLCYPIMSPTLDYEFCKGYYARATGQLHGRVVRLFVVPLIRSLLHMIGYEHHLLRYLNSFRYPLAGEFAMDARIARNNRIPGDWGLEIGVLAEVYRNASVRKICQVDLLDNYDHKHQPLSPDDGSKGLHKMCVDISKTLFRALSSDGVVMSPSFFRTLVVTYVRTAQDLLEWYEHDAALNGLIFDRHKEASAVDTFKRGITEAADAITESPLGVPFIASWVRCSAAVGGILDQVREAVDEDNEVAGLRKGGSA